MSYLSHFLRYRLAILCTYLSAIALLHIIRFFENFNFEGENFLKRKKKFTILEIWQIFKILRIRDSSFVALLILRHLK